MSPAAVATCEQCGATFVPAKAWARFCSEPCRIRSFRAAKRAEGPTVALQRALQGALTVLRSNENPRAALAEVRREIDTYDAAHPSKEAKGRAAAPTTPRPTPVAPVAPVVVAQPRQVALLDVGPAPVAPPVAPTATRPAPDLQARYAAAIAAGHAQKRIAEAIGFRDGTMLSKWRNGVRPLAPEKVAALSAYLSREGL